MDILDNYNFLIILVLRKRVGQKNVVYLTNHANIKMEKCYLR